MKEGDSFASFVAESRGQDSFDPAHDRAAQAIHIIAVGGAGSFGSPALESGSEIIKAAKPIITPAPAR